MHLTVNQTAHAFGGSNPPLSTSLYSAKIQLDGDNKHNYEKPFYLGNYFWDN